MIHQPGMKCLSRLSSQSSPPVVPHLACRDVVPRPRISVKCPLHIGTTTTPSPGHKMSRELPAPDLRRSPGDVCQASFLVDERASNSAFRQGSRPCPLRDCP